MNPTMEKKRSTGRKKIDIKRIEKEENRQVCFSKRRQGLFKKANELSILCGADVAAVVFSLAGKPYSFGHPSVDRVLDRFINAPNPANTCPVTQNYSESLNKGPVLKQYWWDSELSLMGIEELREYEKVLLEYEAMFAQAEQQSCSHASEVTMGQMEGAPAVLEVEKADYFLWLEQQNYELDGCDFVHEA